MKKLLSIVFSITLLAQGAVIAQNDVSKADDAQRIAITPQVNDQTIPQGAKDLLLNKMTQICAKNGLSGDSENPFFIMDASVSVLSKELTATAPPMHALNMQVNFYIKDAMGTVFSETSYEAKGVGQNETKAYIAGIKSINPAAGQFKAFVDKGKTKILEFYNSQCDFVIAKATALQKQGNNREAIKVLKSVPPISKECYDRCMEILATIEHVEDPVAPVVVVVTAPAVAAVPVTKPDSTTKVAPATTPVPATVPVAVPVSPMLIGDVVLAHFEKDDFYHKRYLPAKVQTLPSAATNGETQLIVVNDETPRNTWTTDIISKWHMVTASELHDGSVVIYAYDDTPDKKSVYFPGIVVMTDELYKGIVSIKGRYGDINKVEIKRIAIVDYPGLKAP